MIVLFVSVSVIFSQKYDFISAATFNWEQTSWSGGISPDTAIHTNNQTNWNEYSSKDDVITAGETLTMTPASASKIQTTNTDFNVGALADTQVLGLGSNASIKLEGPGNVEVSAGVTHTCSVGDDGSVYCWGANNIGQLGDNTITQRLTPIQVKGGDQGGVFLSSVNHISAGNKYSYHTCAIDDNNISYCWGVMTKVN